MTFIASVMQRCPIIKSFIIDLYWIVVLSRVNHLACFIIKTIFTKIPEFLIIKVYICPKLIPSAVCRSWKYYINWYLLFKPAVIRVATSYSSSSSKIYYYSPVSKFFILKETRLGLSLLFDWSIIRLSF